MDFVHKKKYGQNFISDTNLLKAITMEADVEKDSDVLEIGPGEGSLTRCLASVANKVVSYEIDKDLIPILNDNLREYSNVKIINQDIMKANMQDIESHFAGKYILVANLPYYITTPILFKFLEESTRLSQLSIMVQKEVAERICAEPNTKAYGIISVIIDSMGKASITRIVKRNMFYPQPNVDSAMVKIVFERKYDIDQAKFNSFVGKCFAMRRKTLINNLMSGLDMSRAECEKVLADCNLDLSIRGEALDTDAFIRLYNIIYK